MYTNRLHTYTYDEFKGYNPGTTMHAIIIIIIIRMHVWHPIAWAYVRTYNCMRLHFYNNGNIQSHGVAMYITSFYLSAFGHE